MSAPTANIEPELNSLKKKLVAEIERDRTEIEIRSKRIATNEGLLRAVKASLGALHPESRTSEYGSKLETIKTAISRIQIKPFTQDDVEKMLSELNPDEEINRNRLRAALWTMASKGVFIRQVAKGNNRQAAQYEKVSSLLPPTKRKPMLPSGNNGGLKLGVT